MVSLDVSVLNVAFRTLVEDFGLDQRTLLAWVFSGYNIAFAAALLTAGRAADRFGRKRTFLVGVAVFGVGSVLCGVAPSAGLLIAARVLQALGGALLLPASLALVLPEFPVDRRSAAIGVWGAVGGIAAATGPTIGGIIVDRLDWRWVFFVNVPVCALALVLGTRVLRESRESTSLGVPDVLGAVLAMSGVGLLTLAVVQGEEWGWTSGRILAVLAGSVALLVLFVNRCRVHPSPVLDLALLQLRFFTAANVAVTVFSMAFFAMFFTNVQFLQEVWRYSIVSSGLALSPGPLVAGVVAPFAGRLAERWGHQRMIVPGLALFAIGIGSLWAFAGSDPSYLTLFLPAMIVTGLGVGLALPTLGSASNAYLPADRFAMGSAFNATCRQVGAALGIAAATALRAGADSPLQGYDRSWAFICIGGVVAAAAMVLLYRRPTPAELAAAAVGPAVVVASAAAVPGAEVAPVLGVVLDEVLDD